MIRCCLLFLLLFTTNYLQAQLLQGDFGISRKDTLRGMLTPPRTCYDVHYYHLDVNIDPSIRAIEGSNSIYFKVTEDTKLIQIDLFENLSIDKIQLDGKKRLKYHREYDAVFCELPKELSKGSFHFIEIHYSGEPLEASNPPWSGGLVWEKDAKGNPWVAITVQGIGASLWWPNKDHQSDEPDSMLISIGVPEGLQNISNGRLRTIEPMRDDWNKYHWFVSYPINNYNITVNIGKYAHFDDLYIGEDSDTLTLDYYVMPVDLEKAKVQFEQVKPMMDFFYKYFGPYPFVRDGYKLVQSPHLGMEHQSAVAYGNDYLNGYSGTGSSEVAIKFDFIILHETAHEWWGNSITTNDIADMWVHESFAAYSEALYVEHQFGYEEAMKYVNSKKQDIMNDQPIIGPFGVNRKGSGDMYNKGQLALNTLRHLVDDDQLWNEIILGLSQEFQYQTVDGQQVIDYISRKAGMDLNYFFDQYFRESSLPLLLVELTKQGDLVTANYRWAADVEDFEMPVKATIAPDNYEFIYPTDEWQSIDLKGLEPDDFKIAEDQFFIDKIVRKTYIDPRR